ncbi:membrane protein DedA with SNARE-associated domain [Cerasibacillus quisquiliarum]|uniref:Alkaline phosphatase n=1 Tax=Cerasibacillus quisquiliarum TaxID=227865 RepID=A0A511V1B7_9BACI|nr:DedA family protein [Cerasibacillus quisquiliarum]MBB5146969.1 membrane protein DedA with SNARE-associated domain [Cerasibacillus quisquiliarum]GEN31708.1 alkaline phosphatase [Cerasibacillus quisquiliarum]
MGVWHDIIGQFGYIVIFLFLSLGIVGVPIPIPDEVLLTYLGYITSLGEISFTVTFIVAVSGSICGITLSYFLGMKLGEPFIQKLFIKRRTVIRTKRLLQKYGSFLIIFSYFIPGIRHVAAYISGVTRYSIKHFLLFASAGAIMWVIIFLSIGNRLGTNWNIIAYLFRKYSISIFAIIILIIVISATIYRYRKQSMS